MTNFEWIKSDDERLEDVLTHSLAVNADTGKMTRCSEIACCNCSFSGHGLTRHVRCNDLREEWLNKEHEPLYKEGDIVLSDKGFIYIVIGENKNTIIVADNINDFYHSIGIIKTEDAINKKIGNIYDNKEE